jgi:uncharacterized protein involved in exopolysaccharide biosynthesis
MNPSLEKPISSLETPHHLSPYGWYPPPYYAEEEINLLDYWRVIKRHSGKVALLTLLCVALATVASFMMSKKYQAEASIMPLAQSGGGGLAALASQVSSLPLIGGQLSGLAGLGGTQKTGQIISILKSRTLIEQIISQFDLMHVFFKKSWDPLKNSWIPNRWGEIPTIEDAVKLVQKRILTVQDDKKTGLIKIQVELKDPELAAQVANQFLVDLQDFINSNQLTVAKRNRIFVEEQLQKNKVELLEFGKKLNQFYSVNRISSVQPQLDVNIGKIQNPPKTFEEFRNQFAELEQQKTDMVSPLSDEERNGVVHDVPSQVYLQYLTLQRELLGRVNALLTQQFELAKIEEAKEDLSFNVIDKAVPPVRPSKPKKLLNIAIAFTTGLFMSLFFAFFLEYIRKMKEAEKAPTRA